MSFYHFVTVLLHLVDWHISIYQALCEENFAGKNYLFIVV